MSLSPAPQNLPAAAAVMLVGVILLAAMDTVAKILSETVPVSQVVWARFIFHAMWMTPIIWQVLRRDPARHFNRRAIGGHAIRGLLIVLSTAFYFTAIRDNPIPDAIVVFFIEPIFVMLLAAIFLGEKLLKRRLLAGFVAFIGVFIALKPGSGEYSWTILLSLLAGLSFAGYIVATRLSTIHGSPLIAAWGTALAGILWAAPFALYDWQPPSIDDWIMMALMGALAASGHLGIAYACRLADASIVGIFHYSEIIFATIISYFVFQHIPDSRVWIGFTLIAGAKITITIIETRKR